MMTLARVSALCWMLCFLPAAGRAQTEGVTRREGDGSATTRSILGRSGFSPQLALHGFSDVTLVAESAREGEEDEASNAFAVGELSLFIVASLTEKISVLGELVFEVEDESEFAVDVERLRVKYTLSDKLWFSVGRDHLGTSYWNHTYHHGLLLQPSVDRPEALRFEDAGGLIPAHAVGVTVGGTQRQGNWGLDYSATLANGRGPRVDEVQHSSDLNNHKATTARLSFFRAGDNTVRFGPVLHLDRIPADAGIPERDGEIKEEIAGFHFVYRQEDGLELIAEYLHVRHDDEVSGLQFDTPTYYALAMWRRWRFKPYVMLDEIDLDPGDPFYADLDPALRRRILGVRFDLHTFNAWKLEYRREYFSTTSANSIAVQTAFTF